MVNILGRSPLQVALELGPCLLLGWGPGGNNHIIHATVVVEDCGIGNVWIAALKMPCKALKGPLRAL